MPKRLRPERLANASIELTEETAQRLLSVMERTGATRPVERIRNSQLASALVGTVGLALFIVGVEHAAADIPGLSNAWGSIIAGLALLSVTGLLLRMLGGHAGMTKAGSGEARLEASGEPDG